MKILQKFVSGHYVNLNGQSSPSASGGNSGQSGRGLCVSSATGIAWSILGVAVCYLLLVMLSTNRVHPIETSQQYRIEYHNVIVISLMIRYR